MNPFHFLDWSNACRRRPPSPFRRVARWWSWFRVQLWLSLIDFFLLVDRTRVVVAPPPYQGVLPDGV